MPLIGQGRTIKHLIARRKTNEKSENYNNNSLLFCFIGKTVLNLCVKDLTI